LEEAHAELLQLKFILEDIHESWKHHQWSTSMVKITNLPKCSNPAISSHIVCPSIKWLWKICCQQFLSSSSSSCKKNSTLENCFKGRNYLCLITSASCVIHMS
jgi:hypothetical protein